MFGRKKLQAEIKTQTARIIDLENEREKWRQETIENQKLHSINADLTKEINKLASQVQKQIEADLFFTSAKICSELFNGKPKKEVKSLLEHQREMQRRLAELATQQQMMPLYGGFRQSGHLGLLGGLLSPLSRPSY